MDTVEWGAAEPEVKRSRPARAWSARSGRGRAAVVMAVLGLVALVATELLPWATLRVAATASAATPGGNGYRSGLSLLPYSRGGTYLLDPYTGQIATSGTGAVQPGTYTVGLAELGGTTAYRLGTLLLLAAVGVVLVARPAWRRPAFGVGLGVLGAQIVVVAGLVHSFRDVLTPDTPTPDGASGAVAATVAIQAGTFCAFASLALLLAALLARELPEQFRLASVGASTHAGPEGNAKADERAGGPDATLADDRPADLTVAPAAPVEVTVSAAEPLPMSYYQRPDGAYYGRPYRPSSRSTDG